ncbi:MAG: hypothetical protein APR63_03350 [Desulfuromonas sp. SDB]|nr:MAG: hypothetical protein APR63_03350 [Desulfuromonas sp. SDB]
MWFSDDYYYPLREFKDLQRRLDQLFEGNRRGTSFPLCNISTDQEKIYLNFLIPGVNQEDINLTTTNDSLDIEVEKKSCKEQQDCVREERISGKFKRAINLPYHIDTDKTEASYRNGILSVTLIRSDQDKPKTIAIKS